MKRSIPSEFPAKYTNNNVTPSRTHYLCGGRDNMTCYACAIGIEAISEVGVDAACEAYHRESLHNGLVRVSGLDRDYANGLEDGWQGVTNPPIRPYTDEYHAGIADGKAAWEACVLAGLVDDDD